MFFVHEISESGQKGRGPGAGVCVGVDYPCELAIPPRNGGLWGWTLVGRHGSLFRCHSAPTRSPTLPYSSRSGHPSHNPSTEAYSVHIPCPCVCPVNSITSISSYFSIPSCPRCTRGLEQAKTRDNSGCDGVQWL